jgi:hypothetical protein
MTPRRRVNNPASMHARIKWNARPFMMSLAN